MSTQTTTAPITPSRDHELDLPLGTKGLAVGVGSVKS